MPGSRHVPSARVARRHDVRHDPRPRSTFWSTCWLFGRCQSLAWTPAHAVVSPVQRYGIDVTRPRITDGPRRSGLDRMARSARPHWATRPSVLGKPLPARPADGNPASPCVSLRLTRPPCASRRGEGSGERRRCLRLGPGATSDGRMVPPSRSPMVSVALVLSVCAVNVLFVVPLAIAGLVICPDPSIRGQMC